MLSPRDRRQHWVNKVYKAIHDETPRIYQELEEAQELYVIHEEVEKVLDMQEHDGIFPVFSVAMNRARKCAIAGGFTQAGKSVFPAVGLLN